MNYQETSREALLSILPHLTKLDAEIMDALERAGEDGLTCDQIERVTGRKHQAVSANLTRLKDRGWIVASGRFGKTAANRKAIIWIATQTHSA